MILSSFSFSTDDWSLRGLDHLGPVNLLVGQNASGKTRTLRSLDSVASFIKGVTKIMLLPESFSASLVFSEPEIDGWQMSYQFNFRAGNIEKEILTVNGETVIHRLNNKATLKGEDIQPPLNKLVIQIRRDRLLYPENELIINWAENVTSLSFSNINNRAIPSWADFIIPYKFSDLVAEMSEQDIKAVVEEAKNLGYDIEELKAVEIHPNASLVSLKESFGKPIIEFELSNGMLRVLYLLCFLQHFKSTRFPSILLIDDMGEGLDYMRATSLGEKVFADCQNQGIQLFASSNDPFMMDVVDLDHWQLICRSRNDIEVLNKDNTPKLFNEFRQTGLSNFDLLASDFIQIYSPTNTQNEIRRIR